MGMTGGGNTRFEGDFHHTGKGSIRQEFYK